MWLGRDRGCSDEHLELFVSFAESQPLHWSLFFIATSHFVQALEWCSFIIVWLL